MARPGSQQIAGYYPTPPELLPAIASLLSFPADHPHAHLLDPCAGEGTAIRTLRDLWAGSHQPPPLFPRSRRPTPGSRPRASTSPPPSSRRTAPPPPTLLSPLTTTTPTTPTRSASIRRWTPSTGATVLFLNPPYDQDPEHGRLEHRFLLRFTAHLHPGAGILLYLVPHASLELSADFLARNYLDLRAFRFPDPEFARFRQVVLLGRRGARRHDLPLGAPTETLPLEEPQEGIGRFRGSVDSRVVSWPPFRSAAWR